MQFINYVFRCTIRTSVNYIYQTRKSTCGCRPTHGGLCCQLILFCFIICTNRQSVHTKSYAFKLSIIYVNINHHQWLYAYPLIQWIIIHNCSGNIANIYQTIRSWAPEGFFYSGGKFKNFSFYFKLVNKFHITNFSTTTTGWSTYTNK